MEPANIDWKNIESVFVEDDLFESINAPKWVDFTAPDQVVDDEAWFCKSECRHPKTAEDYLRSATKVKHFRSLSASENLPLRDRNTREAMSSTSRRLNKWKTVKENEDPNLSSTPPEKRKPMDKSPLKTPPKLRSTLSASNLFAGREILTQITEFCSELKKMVMKTKEGENNKPLIDVQKVKSEAVVVTTSISNEKKPRKLKMNEKENQIMIDMKVVGKKGQEEQQRLLQVRTNPPSPQCFSAYREPLRGAKPITPLKPPRSNCAEKGVLQENSNRMQKEGSSSSSVEKENAKNTMSVAPGKEVRPMEMFWILKPCIAK